MPTEFSSPTVSETVDILSEENDSPHHVLPDLAAARAEKHLDIGDVAYALKVGKKTIENLEARDWAALPGRTFTVGILRAYGNLLGVSVDAMIADVPGESPVMARPVTTKKMGAPKAVNRRGGDAWRQICRMFKMGVIMLLVAMLLAYAVPKDLWQEILAPVQQMINQWIHPEDATTDDAASEHVANAGEAVKPESLPEAVAQAPTTPGTLELRFAAPAWVEVRDHTGRIIYSQLNPAGTTQFVTGAAPLDVLIGNARNVQARWRDEPVKLDKLSADDVSRQTLR